MLVLALVLPIVGTADPVPADDRAHGRYIVVLEAALGDAGAIAKEHARRYGAHITHIYGHAISGYSAELSDEAVRHIAGDYRVLTLEHDVEVTTFAQTVPTGIARASVPTNTTVDIDGSDDVRADVDVAIIDTGIDPDHPDLDVVASIDCTVAATIGSCHAGGRDDHGHGTHVAGTVGAIDNDFGVVGVAPGARLHSVKVLTASGYGLMSDVIAGIDWVTARADTIEVA
ncbi:MAG: S8 family serine peptidase, partial [Actinomycetota bacterium]|nr:S8 family serine peptidase [Actinomycetota bacterium]